MGSEKDGTEHCTMCAELYQERGPEQLTLSRGWKNAPMEGLSPGRSFTGTSIDRQEH